MSKKSHSLKNKHQTHSIVSFQDYLTNPDEPREDLLSNHLGRYESQLQVKDYSMKQQIRNIARAMRNP